MDRLLLFLAVCVSALAVTDPFGVPLWVQAVAGILATGFAAIGIYPEGVSKRRYHE